MYNKAVVEYGMSYDRYRIDFIHANTFHDATDSDTRNDHMVILGRIESFLRLREDLVRKYSVKKLDRDAFVSCMRDFMLEKPRVKSRTTNFECFLDDKVLSVIAEAANDIPLFKRQVTSEDMGSLFNDCMSPADSPLIANRITVLAYFFSRLNYSGIITGRYQHVISTNRLILCPRSGRFIKHYDLSSGLRRFELSEDPARFRIDRWIGLVKAAMTSSPSQSGS